MVENGCGFDVASKKELDQVLKYDINKENIVFANPCKPNSHIKFAAGKKKGLFKGPLTLIGRLVRPSRWIPGPVSILYI